MKKFDFWQENVWKFSKRSVDTLEHIRSSAPYRLYANGGLKGALSNPRNGIAELILWVEIHIQSLKYSLYIFILKNFNFLIVDFISTLHDSTSKRMIHITNMIHVRTLKYSLEG